VADLTTQAALRTAWKIATGSDVDNALAALITLVSELIQGPAGCDRVFAQATVTEYPPPQSCYVSVLFPKRPPVGTITSLHISSAIPRAYDATTLLVDGTDFIVSGDLNRIELVSPRSLYGIRERAVKLVYLGGYETLPKEIERAAQEIIAVKVYKATGQLYHFANVTAADGAIQGARFDDITPDAQRVIEAYRLRTFA
jgi:acyl-CoA synthetase (AMP-forming)/AMP-acid ligase II